MPRCARLDIPGLLYHVIIRGIERRTIFHDDQDRENFVSRASDLLNETDTVCYAWALLDNHAHLLLRPQGRLSLFMRRLLTGYAVVFNLRHRRAGHLFQNRYKSIVCDEEPYLLQVLRYIHLNPVRAGIVGSLDELDVFPWCGHRQLIGKGDRKLTGEAFVLPLFAESEQKARALYRNFVADGLKITPPARLSQGGKRTSLALTPSLGEDAAFDDRILGGGVFVEQVLNGTVARSGGQAELSAILTKVARHFAIAPQALSARTKERTVARAKAVICYLAVRRSGIQGTDVARALGYSSAAVTKAAAKGGVVIAGDREMALHLGAEC